MNVSDGADCIAEGSVGAENRAVLNGEHLEVHVGSHVVFGEKVLWEEVDGRNFKDGGDNDDVCVVMDFLAFGTLLLTTLADVELDTVFVQIEDIATLVVGFALTDMTEGRGVDDGCAGVEALCGSHFFFQIAVVQLLEHELWDY